MNRQEIGSWKQRPRRENKGVLAFGNGLGLVKDQLTAGAE